MRSSIYALISLNTVSTFYVNTYSCTWKISLERVSVEDTVQFHKKDYEFFKDLCKICFIKMFVFSILKSIQFIT